MSGGGGGPIIIRRIAEGSPVSQSDCDKLHEIADRNPLKLRREDAWKVIEILWKYLRD